MRKEENLFKRYLKRKIRITSAFVVGFLISGSIAMAASTDSTNGLSYINKIGKDVIGNKFDNVNNNIKNGEAGVIIGNNTSNSNIDTSASEVGNGVIYYTDSDSDSKAIKLDKIMNNGIISGKETLENIIDLSNSGNGIALVAEKNSVSVTNGIENTGKITGNIDLKKGVGVLSNSGNGVMLEGTNVTSNIQNKGMIQGNGNDIQSVYSAKNTGNGIIISGINNLNNEIISNSGLIAGNINVKNLSKTLSTSGNGLIVATSNAKNISNSGVIKGNAKVDNNSLANNTGNGIFANEVDNLNNTGVVMGSNAALSLGNTNGFNAVNGGVMAGDKIYLSGNTTTDPGKVNSNHGIYLSKNDKVNGVKAQATITIGDAGTIDGKTILNGSTTGVANAENNKMIAVGSGADVKDAHIKTSEIKDKTQKENVIINGTGIKKAALYVDSKFDLTNSVVNAYGTAIEVSGNNQLALGDTTVNGGGLDGNIDLIKGDAGNNTVDIYGSSIINGNINLGAENDTLTIGNSVQLNGMLNDNEGNDILNLGKATAAKGSSNLIVYNNISGFENINTNGDVTLTAASKVTGASNINLQSGNLYLQFNGNNGNKITDHALTGNKGTITSSGGNLVFGVGNLANGTTIAMGGTKIDSNLIKNNHLLTNSGIVSATVDKDNNVVVGFAPDIPVEPPVSGGDKPTPPVPPSEGDKPTPPVSGGDKPTKPVIPINSVLYGKLNAVYHSMVSAGLTLNDLGITPGVNNGLPSKDPNEMNKILTLANQIYANTPYAYTLKSSRDSLKLFEDNMDYLTVKPLKGQSIVQGKAIYTGVRNDSSYSGNDYYGADKGSVNYKTTTNTVGGIATYEYGLDDNTSIGLALGGNHQKVDFKGASDISANSAYIGAFAKKEINNFKLKTGVGYQYTSAKGERNITNGYQNFSNNDKYDINGLNAFAEVKYSIKAGDNWLFEPKAKVSYYYLSQEEVKENNSPNSFALKVDKSNSNTADVEVGADFVKEIALEKAKVKNIVSVGVINTLGENDKSLKANIIGTQEGSQFEIAGAKLPRTSGKVSYNLEVEAQNGMIYSAGVSMEFAKDYNRNINTTLGIGYKF